MGHEAESRIIYCSLILPHLTYCVEVWGNSYKNNIQALCVIQKKAIRILNFARYRDHTNVLFLQSKILKFKDLVEFKTNQLMFKIQKNMLPANIQELFCTREGYYNLRNKNNFKKQYSRTTLKSMCITRCGVNLWNCLDDKIKAAENSVHFKKLYKSYFLQKYAELEFTVV